MFIPILCMFRAPTCSSSGETIVSIRHLVYVTLCRWPSGMQACIPDGHTRRVTYTRCRIDTIDSLDDEHMGARNMYKTGIKHIRKKKCASSWLFVRTTERIHLTKLKNAVIKNIQLSHIITNTMQAFTTQNIFYIQEGPWLRSITYVEPWRNVWSYGCLRRYSLFFVALWLKKETHTCSLRCLLLIKLAATTLLEDHPINAFVITLPLKISALISGHRLYIGTQFLPHFQCIPFLIKRPLNL